MKFFFESCAVFTALTIIDAVVGWDSSVVYVGIAAVLSTAIGQYLDKKIKALR